MKGSEDFFAFDGSEGHGTWCKQPKVESEDEARG